jgi:hypothetical protein
MLNRRFGAAKEEIITRKIDIDLGTFFSNLVMFFIIARPISSSRNHFRRRGP